MKAVVLMVDKRKCLSWRLVECVRHGTMFFSSVSAVRGNLKAGMTPKTVPAYGIEVSRIFASAEQDVEFTARIDVWILVV